MKKYKKHTYKIRLISIHENPPDFDRPPKGNSDPKCLFESLLTHFQE